MMTCQLWTTADLLVLHLRRHVLEVHRAATQRREVAEDEARQEAFFKRYLEFCRARVAPRLSEPAADSLVSQYVELREQVVHTNSNSQITVLFQRCIA